MPGPGTHRSIGVKRGPESDPGRAGRVPRPNPSA